MKLAHLTPLILFLVLATTITSAQISCPTLSVTGPAGYIRDGMATVFTINADLPNLENLKYYWTASAGRLDQGQGTPSIYLITSNADGGKELKVKVQVTGLPDGCSDTAEFEYGELRFERDPPMLEEYGRVSLEEERERLDVVAAEWKKYQDSYLYIILYLAPRETRASEQARTKRIREHLTRTHKIPEERLVFVNGGVFQRSTRIYRVPEAPSKSSQ